MLNTKYVYIIHGYGASPERHWFPWLQGKLQSSEVRAAVLSMPEPLTPSCTAWIHALQQQITTLTENTYFVAHSLGCITLLTYLQQAHLSGTIGGLLLVSGFAASLPTLPLLDAFTRTPPDYARICQIAPKRAVLSAHDDPVVPFALSQGLARQLHADFYARTAVGHFLDETGVITLPPAYDIITAMMR